MADMTGMTDITVPKAHQERPIVQTVQQQNYNLKYSHRWAPLLLPYRRRFFSIQRCKVPCVTSRLRLEVRPELRCPNCRRGPGDVASRAIGMLIGPHRASSSDFILASRHAGAARAPRPGRRALRLLLHSGLLCSPIEETVKGPKLAKITYQYAQRNNRAH